MSAKELQRWQVLYSLQPWGDDRIDLMLARLCAVVANAAQINLKRSERVTFRTRDFLFDYWPDHEREDAKARGAGLFAKLRGIAQRHNEKLEYRQRKVES